MGRRVTQLNARVGADHGGRFLPVLDSRKRKVRGLWSRNGRFYAQMRVDQGDGRTKPVRVPLKSTTLDLAREEMEERRTERRKGTIHLPGHRPKFEVLAEEYKSSAVFLGKKKGTRENETQALKRWSTHLGGVRIDWIKTSHLNAYRNERAKAVSARTINLDFVAFNNAMAYAVTAGHVTTAPRLKKLEEDKPAKRKRLTPELVERLLGACTPAVTKNASQVAYYLRFLILTGGREKESLTTAKDDVDLDSRKVTIGADGDTKNREFRTVDMSDELYDMLKELLEVLPADTTYLFPSPQRGRKDVPSKSLRESFKLVREAAGLKWVGFHDFRHFYSSQCVMAGVDFMTIAEWLGHKDGGILVGRTYGHLNDAHKERMASGLRLLGAK